tara:strand:+ start:373 stop:528 length:156 start_codon:yes stop_codon:yes gene_type:complete
MEIITLNSTYNSSKIYRFTELVDTADSKSADFTVMGVQVSPEAPFLFTMEK